MSSKITKKRPLKAVDNMFHERITASMERIKSRIGGSVKGFVEEKRPRRKNVRTAADIFDGVETPMNEDGERIMIRVSNLSKIYGKHPAEALRLLEEEKNKEEVQNLTSNNVGLYNVSFEVMKG